MKCSGRSTPQASHGVDVVANASRCRAAASRLRAAPRPQHGHGRHLGPRRAQATILGSISIYTSRSTRSAIERGDRVDLVSRHISRRGRYNLARSRAISSKTTTTRGYGRQVCDAEISIAPRIVSARGDEREREPPPRGSSSPPTQTRRNRKISRYGAGTHLPLVKNARVQTPSYL